MRKLKTSDVFAALRVVNSANLRDELKIIVEEANENKNVNIADLGVDFMLSIMEKAAGEKTEKDIYRFLSGILECAPEEAENMALLELVKNLNECIDIEEWKVFFKYVSGLTTKQMSKN